jgi:hypothetical protein
MIDKIVDPSKIVIHLVQTDQGLNAQAEFSAQLPLVQVINILRSTANLLESQIYLHHIGHTSMKKSKLYDR